MREGDRPSGLRRLWLAALNSRRGLVNCYRSEAAFRQECWAALPLLPLAFVVGHTSIERALLIGSVLLVLIVELLNTAVEVVIDRIGLERHELSGFAKDLGSAAVLIVLVLAAVTWCLILLD